MRSGSPTSLPRIALPRLAGSRIYLAELLGGWRSGELPGGGGHGREQSRRARGARRASAGCRSSTFRSRGSAQREEQERRLVGLLRGYDVETVVLARYMQVLGDTVLEAYPARIINIHHSFLPAFVGAKPYQQAQRSAASSCSGQPPTTRRPDLDEGPITAQDVVLSLYRTATRSLIWSAGADAISRLAGPGAEPFGPTSSTGPWSSATRRSSSADPRSEPEPHGVASGVAGPRYRGRRRSTTAMTG